MPSPKSIFSSQPFVNAFNTAYGLGLLTFDLSQAANIIGNGQVAPQRVSVTLNSSGICPSTSIWFSDQLNPTGTTYLMQLFDKSGNFAANFGQIVLSGASPFDLSTLIPTFVGGNSLSFPNPVLQNPSASQTITGQSLTLTSSAPLIAQGNVTETGLSTASSFNGVLWVDGVKYTTMAAAYAALPSSGGTVMVPSNYSETLVANLTLNKNNAGIMFTGPATIAQGTNQVIVSPGTNGAFVRSILYSAQVSGVSPVFTYNGSAEAWKVGTSAANTTVYFENININLTQGGTPAGATAIGLRLNSVVLSRFDGVSVYPQADGQIGLLCDGTGNFTGSNLFNSFNCGPKGATSIAIKLTNNSSINTFNNYNCSGPSGTAIDMTVGLVESNVFNGCNIEGISTALNFGANAIQNRFHGVWFEANTTDIAWGTSSNNFVGVGASSAGGTGLGPIQTDGGSTGNVAGVIGGTLLNVQGPTGTLTGNGADQTIYTYTLPARILGPGKGLRIRMWISTGNIADTPTFKINFGTMVLINSAPSGTSTQTPYMEAVVFNNSGVTGAQVCCNAQNFTAATNTYNCSGGLTGTVDTTNSVVILATFNEANPKTVVGKQFIVELIH